LLPRTLAISLHTVIQFADGAIWVHSADTDQSLSSSDSGLLQVLAAFRTPADPEVVARESARPAVALQQIVELTAIGALVGAAASDAEVPEIEPGRLVPQYMSPLAASLDSLAGALGAIGPTVAQAIREESGVGLEARLIAITSGLVALQQVIGSRIPGWIDQQLRRLDLPERGLSVHVGAGSSHLEGWVNVDLWPAPLSLDFRWGLPFAAGSTDRVYLSHVLEHAYYPNEALQLLREIHRVLRPGGRVRIVVPDIEACIAAYCANDRRFIEGRREHWPDWNIRTRMESFLGFAGVGPHPGMFGETHKWGYDFETLAHVLTQVGFVDIRRCGYQASTDLALRVDHASAWAGANVDGSYYSLFVEAQR